MGATWDLIKSGGFIMVLLLVCSLVVWAVIFERWSRYRKLGQELSEFQLQAVQALLRRDRPGLRTLCQKRDSLPSARLVLAALERLDSEDVRIRARWAEAVERRRLLENQALRSNLWVLGTIATASPFVGLFGTVIGILRSFGDISRSGAGGFAVVAGGISEALVATAAGIGVAVVAVVAYNAFQTRWSALVLTLKLQAEELAEYLGDWETSNRESGSGA
jgi:biopolymer transport protein ExbB